MLAKSDSRRCPSEIRSDKTDDGRKASGNQHGVAGDRLRLVVEQDLQRCSLLPSLIREIRKIRGSSSLRHATQADSTTNLTNLTNHLARNSPAATWPGGLVVGRLKNRQAARLAYFGAKFTAGDVAQGDWSLGRTKAEVGSVPRLRWGFRLRRHRPHDGEE
jgi:hypothetical protein